MLARESRISPTRFGSRDWANGLPVNSARAAANSITETEVAGSAVKNAAGNFFLGRCGDEKVGRYHVVNIGEVTRLLAVAVNRNRPRS